MFLLAFNQLDFADDGPCAGSDYPDEYTSSSYPRMAPSRPRSASPPADAPAAKRVKTEHSARDVMNDLYPNVLSGQNSDSLRSAYASSTPYLHGVIDKLFDDTLLRKASEEIIRELHFTEKETDIYKVLQPPSLQNF